MKFQLFHRFDAEGLASPGPAAADLYGLLQQFRAAVLGETHAWSRHPTMRGYADITFWAIRKQEYGFAAEQFALLETAAQRQLRVLDVGSGVVPLCNWISRRGHSVTATDPIESEVELLRNSDINGFYAANVDYQVARGERLPFPDATFDVVTCISVLEHVAPGNDRLVLWEIARVLKPGGSLIVTFDVSPPTGRAHLADAGWPTDRRHYAEPFSRASAERLLRSINAHYAVGADSLPPELEHLTWDEVHAFWRTAQGHDGRAEPEREYVAMGGVLGRRTQIPQVPQEEIADAYLEGQAALEERVRFFHANAQERLELIDRLNQEGHGLISQVQEKEQLIQSLETEMHQRGEASNKSATELASVGVAAERNHVRLDVLERHLVQHGSLLGELSSRVEGMYVALQHQTDVLRDALKDNGAPGLRDYAVLQAILAWREDLSKVLAQQTERLEAAAVVRAEAAVADELRALRRDKDAAEDTAHARLVVIQEQSRALERRRRFELGYRFRQMFEPRIGVLYHYAPRALNVPSWYTKSKILATWPTISIVTPTRNQGQFIERTVRSVIGQDYEQLEYIIRDGASTDETLQVLEQFSQTEVRVVSEPDDGFASAINRGFAATSGDILAYLNSDDLLLPGTLNYVAQYFDKHPEVDVVYGHRVLIDEYDREIGRWVLPPHDDDVLSWADYVPQETLFWRRRIWEKVGSNVDEEFQFAVDWDILLRFRDAGAKMVRLPRFLAAFRVHPHQKTSTEMQVRGEAEMARLRERALGRLVSEREIDNALSGYLRRHFIHHKLYRLGVLRY